MKMLLLSMAFVLVSKIGGKLLLPQALVMLQLSPKVSVAISSNCITITKISIQVIVTLQGIGIISLGMVGEAVYIRIETCLFVFLAEYKVLNQTGSTKLPVFFYF